MKIKVLTTFGRRRVMGSAKILPGVYEHDDPALFGLADELLENGFAVPVDNETPARVPAPKQSAPKPAGPTHEEFEQATGRSSVTVDEPAAPAEIPQSAGDAIAALMSEDDTTPVFDEKDDKRGKRGK